MLYPIPDFSQFDKPVKEPTDDLPPLTGKTVFLSINRYERKKNIPLAIRALGKSNNILHQTSIIYFKFVNFKLLRAAIATMIAVV